MLTEKKLQLAQGYSDPLTIFHVYKVHFSISLTYIIIKVRFVSLQDFTYINNKDTEAAIAYLKENFLSYQTIDEIKQIRYQLLQYLIKLGFVIINSHVNPRSKHDNIRSITGSQVGRNLLKNNLQIFIIIILILFIIILTAPQCLSFLHDLHLDFCKQYFVKRAG